MGRFASSGVVVGQTLRSKRDQRSDQLKGNKVTMGKNVPRQTEGAVGDITVREISVLGLRCYIKTNSGWFDINTLESANRTEWPPLTLRNSWVHHSASYSEPAYFKDERGFVHLRGGIKDGSAASSEIATLPTGFRPAVLTIVAGAIASGQTTVKITSGGIINIANGGSTSLSFLDGISFYAGQTITGSGGGSSSGGGRGGVE